MSMSETIEQTSTEVVDTAHAARIRAELLALQRRVAPPSSNKISTKGKLFTLPDGKNSPGPLNVVILDFTAVNSFYEGVYNPQSKSPPVCWSVGQDLDTMVPSDKATKPQAASCDACPKNDWGSGFGGRGKACKNTRRLIVVPPKFDDKTPPMTLYVSPTGLKQWDAYVRRLAIEYTARPIDVVTSISFDSQQQYPTLQFDFKEKTTNVLGAEKLRELARDVLFREPDAPAKAA